MALAHVERKLSEAERSEFWRFDAGGLLIRLLCAFFTPEGFPGANLSQEKKDSCQVA